MHWIDEKRPHKEGEPDIRVCTPFMGNGRLIITISGAHPPSLCRDDVLWLIQALQKAIDDPIGTLR